MIAFRSVRNLELGLSFGDVLYLSRSRRTKDVYSTLSFPKARLPLNGKFHFLRASFEDEPSSSIVVSEDGWAKEKEEVKNILASFLEKKGLGSDVSVETDLLLEARYGVQNVADNFKDPTVNEVNSVSQPISPYITAFTQKKLRALSMVDKRDLDGNLSPLVLYLLDLGFDLEQIKTMVRKCPSLIGYTLEGKIKPLIEFLLVLGVSKSDIPTIFRKWPRLWGWSVKKKLLPTVALLESLGVDKSRWPLILRRGAYILTLRRQNIEATVNFLMEMGVPSEKIGKIIERSPNLMSCSIKGKIRPICEYFRPLGVDVGHLLHKYPPIFNLSIESNLKHVTRFFLENGFSEEELGLMIARFGAIYSLSLANNLVPKWEYFLSMDYPKEHLVSYPQFFSYSLEKRIKPRYALVKEYGVKMSLNTMLSLSDLKFDRALNKKLDNDVSDKAPRVFRKDMRFTR